jgi:aspartate racemase
MKKKILGVLGGMGPAASARFYTLLTAFTKASKDQEHMEILLHSMPSIPDRTEFILGRSPHSPSSAMCAAAARLSDFGADIIAIPCNTAEYFHNEIAASSAVPVLFPAGASARFAKAAGIKKLGILATEGTVSSGIYEKHLYTLGIDYALPSKDTRAKINELIYSCVKSSLPAESRILSLAAAELRALGCDAAVLGCTELSLIPIAEEKEFFIDSLSVLAAACVCACGYTLSEQGKPYAT